MPKDSLVTQCLPSGAKEQGQVRRVVWQPPLPLLLHVPFPRVIFRTKLFQLVPFSTFFSVCSVFSIRDLDAAKERKNRASAVVSSTSIGRVHYSQSQALTTAEQAHGHGGSTTGKLNPLLCARLSACVRDIHFQICEQTQNILQEDGWPLGLRPLNARAGLVRNRDFNGSISFSTLLTASNSSFTDSSSDLDTESTGSFFHDKSLTLGSLIGVSSILELSRRSNRGRTTETLREQKNYKSKPWMFSICSRLSPDVVNTNNNAPSLGHFLEVERRAAANIHRRNMIYGPRDFSPILPNSGVNSQFLGDQIAPQSSASLGVDGGRRSNTELLQHGNGYGASLVLSCLCGQLIE
ncbi:hypothetical protein POTOM_025101 [Populus tomentosa]|uniref:Uncharacterized protein n=1 Tax=Populus tomentosa TaxID=118781 RepID=A0A8X8CWR5_POPTO|nr:hypothetical protein POTOM_025101 [Populus tomentosa]